ncbi:alpha-amylase family protein [Candidatus Latescibacterota bacterium]
MKKNTALFVVLFLYLAVSVWGAEMPVGTWWLDKPLRLVQTNLREIDIIDFDVDRYERDALDMGANVVLINVGGIVANYPSGLPFQYVNPDLKFDVIGEVIERMHANGIRVIGRFDFSKLNETIAGHHPDWLYVSEVAGKSVNYNGQVHTCVNGGYQQECLFRILDEATNRYALDGIFFNMIGYQTSDYSGNYHGICQSESCKDRFHEWSDGLTLPTVEDEDDPVFRKYQEFKRETSNELFYKVGEFIKSKNPDLCICTYTHAGVDLVRMESDSSLDGHPDWEFRSTDNVKTFLGSYRDKQISNTAVHFPTYGFRHSSVSPYLTERRLIENMLNGAGLDYYCIGRIDNQEDRAVLKNVRGVFQFHEKNERYFNGITSNAEVLLINKREWNSLSEYKGFVRILTENHVLFDVMDSWRLDHTDSRREIEDYKVVILPDIQALSDNACRRLDEYVKNGGKILVTGYTSTKDELGNPMNSIRLNSLGAGPDYTVLEKTKGRYFKIRPSDKTHLTDPMFEDLDIVYLNGDFLESSLKPGAEGYFGLIRQAMFGPPEKSYYSEVSDVPGMIVNQFGRGRSAYLPWGIGEHYDFQSHHGHSMLVMAALDDLLEYSQPVQIDGSPLVEVTRQVSTDGAFEWIGLANHSGQLGTAVHEPVPLIDTAIKILQENPEKPVKSVRLLKADTAVEFSRSGGWIELTVQRLEAYEVVVLVFE